LVRHRDALERGAAPLGALSLGERVPRTVGGRNRPRIARPELKGTVCGHVTGLLRDEFAIP